VARALALTCVAAIFAFALVVVGCDVFYEPPSDGGGGRPTAQDLQGNWSISSVLESGSPSTLGEYFSNSSIASGDLSFTSDGSYQLNLRDAQGNAFIVSGGNWTVSNGSLVMTGGLAGTWQTRRNADGTLRISNNPAGGTPVTFNLKRFV